MALAIYALSQTVDVREFAIRLLEYIVAVASKFLEVFCHVR